VSKSTGGLRDLEPLARVDPVQSFSPPLEISIKSTGQSLYFSLKISRALELIRPRTGPGGVILPRIYAFPLRYVQSQVNLPSSKLLGREIDWREIWARHFLFDIEHNPKS